MQCQRLSKYVPRLSKLPSGNYIQLQKRIKADAALSVRTFLGKVPKSKIWRILWKYSCTETTFFFIQVFSPFWSPLLSFILYFSSSLYSSNVYLYIQSHEFHLSCLVSLHVTICICLSFLKRKKRKNEERRRKQRRI